MKNTFLLFTAIAVTVFTGCRKTPQANISADKTSVEVNEKVVFSNSTIDGVSYKWDFGDETTSTEKAPNKSYSKSGKYVVSMTAYSKNEKKSDAKSITITVNDYNKKFEGSYLMGSSSCVDGHTMPITVTGTMGLILNNFLGMGWAASAVVQSNGTSYIIPSQTFTDGDGDYSITGTGTLSGNTLIINFSVTYTDYYDSSDNFSNSSCSVTGTKL
jgi:PKD repeat protein